MKDCKEPGSQHGQLFLKLFLEELNFYQFYSLQLMYSSCESVIAYVRYSSDFVEFEKYALGKENFKFVDDANIPKMTE